MSGPRPRVARASYLKTTAACAGATLFALVVAVAGGAWLSGVAAAVVVLVAVAGALGAGVAACAGAVVLARETRLVRGDSDLFMDLNRSRELAGVAGSVAPGSAPLRRWISRTLGDHDLLVGDLVEVKSWPEIQATLDAQGCLEQLPFMPEMAKMCGKRVKVFRSMHRLFDYRKTRVMREMRGAVLLAATVCDGGAHGGCEAACHSIWKAAWLRRVDPREPRANPQEPSTDLGLLMAAAHRDGEAGPRYTCQLTQLHAASHPLARFNPGQFLLPVVSGNVTLSAFIVGWLTHGFNELQHVRGGIAFPSFEPGWERGAVHHDEPLHVGDTVFVRPPDEIRATLNDNMMHRGMWFEPDMLKHCGQARAVQAEVKRIIDIVSGEMRTMKTPAFMLREVHFTGERQLFNTQHEPLFWRAAWLRRG